MKFVVLNRIGIENSKPLEKHIVISVRDPESKIAKFPKNSNRLAELFLEFHDLNIMPSGKGIILGANKPYILFNDLHARVILDFFNQWYNKVNLVLVNCEAGICRSSAIAAALSEIMSQSSMEFFKKYLPNSLVYKTILEEHYK